MVEKRSERWTINQPNFVLIGEFLFLNNFGDGSVQCVMQSTNDVSGSDAEFNVLG